MNSNGECVRENALGGLDVNVFCRGGGCWVEARVVGSELAAERYRRRKIYREQTSRPRKM
jgi:hypothetical protein